MIDAALPLDKAIELVASDPARNVRRRYTITVTADPDVTTRVLTILLTSEY